MACPYKEKSMFMHVLMELRHILAFYHKEQIETYLKHHEGKRIQLRWPKHRQLVLCRFENMTFITQTYEELAEKWDRMLCCPETLRPIGYVERCCRGKSIFDTINIIILLGENERFYGADLNADALYILGETAAVFASLGLHRFDPIYYEDDIAYITKIDNVLQDLIEAKKDIWAFTSIVAKNNGRCYRINQKRDKLTDEIFVLLFTPRDDLIKKVGWNFLNALYDLIPPYSCIIGSVGMNLLYPKSVFVLIDQNCEIYGINTLSNGLGPCVKIAEDFEIFLKQGTIKAYKRYKFFENNVYTYTGITPLCPHLFLRDSSSYVPEFESDDE